MNQTLEQMARAIFQDWFVDFGPTRAKLVFLFWPVTTYLNIVRNCGPCSPTAWCEHAVGGCAGGVGG